MEKRKFVVYVLITDFNSEDDNNHRVRVFMEKSKALQAYRDYVKAEKESDFVRNSGYDEVVNYEQLDDWNICFYWYGNNEYYTKVRLERVVLE